MLNWKETRKVVDKEGLYVLEQGAVLGIETATVGVYAPNSALLAFWNNIFLLMEEIKNKFILLLGD